MKNTVFGLWNKKFSMVNKIKPGFFLSNKNVVCQELLTLEFRGSPGQ